MPSSSDEERQWAESKFGTIDSEPITVWLEGRGFVLTPDWEFFLPGRHPQGEEVRALWFLVEEWDFGFMVPGMNLLISEDW